MSVVLVAIITPLPGHADEVIAVFTERIPLVHAEDGCELYALHRAGDKLIMIEKWASRAALDAHSQRASQAGPDPRLAGKLSGPAELIIADAVPAGDSAKGQL
jgi:quinol monooxygenase YgiN